MMWPLAKPRSSCVSLSKSKNTTPNPTKGSVAGPIPLSGVAYANSRSPEAAIEAVHLEIEIGDDEVELPVAVVVAGIGAHAGARPSVGRHRHAGAQRDLRRSATPSGAVEQEVRHAVVGDEHLRPPVIVEVGDDDAEAVAAMRADAGLRADVGEDALAVVAVDDVRQRLEVERMTVEARSAAGRCRRRGCAPRRAAT